MKKRQSLTIFMFVTAVLFLSACAGAEPEQLTEIEGEIAQEASTFVESYKTSMIDAVNSGSFNKVESYLIKNTSFYHSLRRYVEELSVAGTKKELESFEVKKVYVDEYEEVYVDVHEKVVIYEKDHEEHIEREEQFHLATNEDSFRIVNIKIFTEETTEHFIDEVQP